MDWFLYSKFIKEFFWERKSLRSIFETSCTREHILRTENIRHGEDNTREYVVSHIYSPTYFAVDRWLFFDVAIFLRREAMLTRRSPVDREDTQTDHTKASVQLLYAFVEQRAMSSVTRLFFCVGCVWEKWNFLTQSTKCLLREICILLNCSKLIN